MTTAAAGRKRGRPGYERETVLRRAVEVFNEVGYDGTSVGLLAANLGLTKSAIYHHVSSKEELLEQALDVALSALEDVLRERELQIMDPAQRLRYVVRETVLVLTDKQPYVRLLLRLHGNSEVEMAALQRRRRFDESMATVVDAARAAGVLRNDIDPVTTARLIFGTINSVAEWYDPAGPTSPEALADQVVAMIFDGLVAH